MIDIHAHILPGIDDGAADLETSIKMLKMAQEDGVKTIAATPHYYPGYFEIPYDKVECHILKLREEAKKNGIDIEIIYGQEIFIDKNTIKHLKAKNIGTINKTKYMLVEFPMDFMPDYALDVLYELKIAGITPIVAHPERYDYIINKISTINDIANEGCLFQINTGSISGIFGKSVQKTAEKLIKHGFCSFIASDCHTTNRRNPCISNAVSKLSNNDILENSRRLVNNIDVHSDFELIREKRSIFQFYKRNKAIE